MLRGKRKRVFMGCSVLLRGNVFVNRKDSLTGKVAVS